jgi:hypothetical protein
MGWIWKWGSLLLLWLAWVLVQAGEKCARRFAAWIAPKPRMSEKQAIFLCAALLCAACVTALLIRVGG